MEALGAVADECEAVRRIVGIFLRWAERRHRTPDRTAGIAWLRAVSERLEPERRACVKTCLATWFHLTGGARVGKQSWVGQPASQSAGGSISGEAASWREAGERLNGYLACKSYSRNTVTCYLGWARRFFRWCRQSGKDLPEVAASDIRGFLEWLASTGVVAKTQNQALNALISFFRHGIGKEPGEIGSYLRARVTRRLPVVLNRKEAAAVINDLEGRSRPMWLLAGVMLGAGLRLREALELRVHDLDLERGTITVRRGKGDKDRVSVLPERIRAGLTAHLADRRAQFERDLDMGAGYVPLPGGLARKKPGAARSWAWQYVFGGQNLIVESATGHLIRWHVHENTVGRLLGESARRCGVLRQVTCHSLRHTFATLALENGTDIRTLQELLGHNDVSTTMIYTHVMNRPGVVARSPLDGLAA
jgi:integron integrase